MSVQPPTGPQGTEPFHFLVRQRFTAMVNRYEIVRSGPDWAPGELIAFAQQKRFAFKEEVTFYTDDTRTAPVFSFKARKKLDLGSGYDIYAADGAPIGYFKKEFAASLLRSTWQLQDTAGIRATGQERSQGVALLRRFWDAIPIIGDIPVPFLFHFDFVDATGGLVLSSEKKAAIRDSYRVSVFPTPAGTLDWRVAATMAVALDALQSR